MNDRKQDGTGPMADSLIEELRKSPSELCHKAANTIERLIDGQRLREEQLDRYRQQLAELAKRYGATAD